MLAYLVAVWLFVVGIYGVITSRHLVHLVTCLSVAQASTYVLLLASATATAARRRLQRHQARHARRRPGRAEPWRSPTSWSARP